MVVIEGVTLTNGGIWLHVLLIYYNFHMNISIITRGMQCFG